MNSPGQEAVKKGNHISGWGKVSTLQEIPSLAHRQDSCVEPEVRYKADVLSLKAGVIQQ